jgi:hypothetical protein
MRKNFMNEKTKNNRKPVFLLKRCESLYTCSPAPFIGRGRDFYISIIPSDLENIPNGNMYINVFSYPVICGTNFGYSQTVIHSHSKPELLAPRP